MERALEPKTLLSSEEGKTLPAGGPPSPTGEVRLSIPGYEILGELGRDNPILYGVDLVRNRLYLASQRALSGKPAEAMACIRRAEDVLSRSSRIPLGMPLYDMACAHGLWSVAGQDGAIAPLEREARARRAISALRRAGAAGHRNLHQIRHDPVLDPLRRASTSRSC